MYRTYSNPYDLEKRLNNMEREYENLIKCGRTVDELCDLMQDIQETKDQINFAWQDDEASIYGLDY